MITNLTYGVIDETGAKSYSEEEDYMWAEEKLLDEFSNEYNSVGGFGFLVEQVSRIEDDERDEVEELL